MGRDALIAGEAGDENRLDLKDVTLDSFHFPCFSPPSSCKLSFRVSFLPPMSSIHSIPASIPDITSTDAMSLLWCAFSPRVTVLYHVVNETCRRRCEHLSVIRFEK